MPGSAAALSADERKVKLWNASIVVDPTTKTFYCFLCKRHVGQKRNAYLHVETCPKAATR